MLNSNDLHFFYSFSQIFSFFLTFYFDSFSLPNCFTLTILSVLSFLITFKGLLPSSTDSSPCFHLLLFLLLPFIQNTSLNPPLHYIPPPPSSFTSSLQPLLLSSRSHYSSSPAVRPDLSTPCPLPFISSKFPFFIVFKRSCLFFTPICVCLCVCVWSQVNTPLLATHLNDSTDWSGQKTLRRQRCTPFSYCLSYHW